MPCNHVKLPGGGHAIVCSRGSQRKSCVTCGKPAPLLCDYPVTRNGKAETCDRPCCRQHVVSVGSDKDYCLAHTSLARQKGEIE